MTHVTTKLLLLAKIILNACPVVPCGVTVHSKIHRYSVSSWRIHRTTHHSTDLVRSEYLACQCTVQMLDEHTHT